MKKVMKNYFKWKDLVHTVHTAKNGNKFTGDKILVTVPIKILQGSKIKFTPELPKEKTDAINNVVMVDGIKIFIEFKEKFYPDKPNFC